MSKNIYGFKSLKSLPAVEQMADFELDLINMIKNLEFKKVGNVLSGQLNIDIEQIKNNNKIFFAEDKSRNTYIQSYYRKTSPKPTRNQLVKNYSILIALQKRLQKNC